VRSEQKICQKAEDGFEMSKSHARQTKCQIRINYNWDGKEVYFVDLVSSFVKEYLFPRVKFLKDRWMEYDKEQDSFLTFVQGKVKIPEGAEYKDQCEIVICPTIQANMSLQGAISTMRFKEHTRVSAFK
jgi:hypothetical protein